MCGNDGGGAHRSDGVTHRGDGVTHRNDGVTHMGHGTVQVWALGIVLTYGGVKQSAYGRWCD